MRTFHQILLAGLLAVPMTARAQLTYTFSGINEAIPDGTPTGLVNVHNISDAAGLNIADLNVTLNISSVGGPGFNGDLYVTLQHDSGYSVLLNRPGARVGATYGYSDSGLGVTLDDAAAGDVHVYRQVLNGNHTTPLAGALSGTWKPDGRITDPATVLDTDASTAKLSSFNGVPVNGTWSLFVTDLSSGATHQLDSWSLEMVAVPEPAMLGCVTGSVLLLVGLWRRRAARTRTPSK